MIRLVTRPVSALLVVCIVPCHAQAEPERQLPEFRPIRVLDGFPPIRDAPVINAAEVTDEVRDNALVLGVVVNGQARAWPINMLNGPRREIINDTLGGQPIAATW